MGLNKLSIIIFISQLIISCSTSYEVTMPYKNWGYSGERLLPVKTSNSKFSLRIWINNSTSIDRVISVSKDTFDDYKGHLVEYGSLYNGLSTKDFYRESVITPKNGFTGFIRKINDLNLFTVSNKPTIGVVDHQPISVYIVEIKRDSLYNIFKFETNYPAQTFEINQYNALKNYFSTNLTFLKNLDLSNTGANMRFATMFAELQILIFCDAISRADFQY